MIPDLFKVAIFGTVGHVEQGLTTWKAHIVAIFYFSTRFGLIFQTLIFFFFLQIQ